LDVSYNFLQLSNRTLHVPIIDPMGGAVFRWKNFTRSSSVLIRSKTAN
jgi:hypothetical protein